MADQTVCFEEFFPAPRERVFNYFADPKNLERLWGARWKRIQDGQDPAHPNGVGSIRDVRAGAFKFEETITAYQPNQLIEYTVTKGGPLKNHLARIAFTDAPRGTRVAYTIEFDTKLAGTGGLLAATLRLSWRVGAPKVVRDLEGGR